MLQSVVLTSAISRSVNDTKPQTHPLLLVPTHVQPTLTPATNQLLALKVVLRALQTLRMVKHEGHGVYRCTEAASGLADLPCHESVTQMLKFSWALDIPSTDTKKISAVTSMLDCIKQRWVPATEQLACLLDGLVLAPLLIAMHKHACGWNYSSKIFNIARGLGNPDAWMAVTDIFAWLRWSHPLVPIESDGCMVMTSQGRFLLENCLNMGVAVSYAPLLLGAKTLVYGAPADVISHDEFGHETHVDRTLNVIGSGAMHGTFFRALCVEIGDM